MVKLLALKLLAGQSRHIISALGWFVVSQGWASEEQVTFISGLALAAMGHGWSAFEKWQKLTGPTETGKEALAAPDMTPQHPPQVVEAPPPFLIDGKAPGGFTLSDRSRKALRGVDPTLVRVVERALELSPVDFVVTEGLRTAERQQKLLAEGKSWVKRSRHQDGMAIDLVAWVNGTVDYNTWSHYETINTAFQEAARQLRCRITWGGDWDSKDGVHFQLESEFV